MDTTKELFDLVDSIGETITGPMHIIDTTDAYPVEGEKSYRVYHSGGYCFDVLKEAEHVDEETGAVTKWGYGIYCDYDEFNKINKTEAIALLRNIKQISHD